MNRHACFVTGTDTEVGKTFVSCAMLAHLASRGLRVVGMKPVAAGLTQHQGASFNEDVARLIEASNVRADASLINPFRITEPIAPHIGAAEEGIELSPLPILNAFRQLREMADVVVVEGVGGFRVPLGPSYDTADLAAELGLPVILVVGMKLGCISHALLSAEAIRARGLAFAGWIANRVDPRMLRIDENISALEQRLGAPLLASVPHSRDGSSAGMLELRKDLLDCF